MPVPVFGSGDVFRAEDPARMLAETGCAGVMIARGAMGNPFIFREARALLEGRATSRTSAAERSEVARKHLELSAKFLGEKRACVEFRKQFCSYSRGTISGAELRAEAVRSSSLEDFGRLFDRWAAMTEDSAPESASESEARPEVQGDADFLL
jgi:tRNA-dihydrouridine synthase